MIRSGIGCTCFAVFSGMPMPELIEVDPMTGRFSRSWQIFKASARVLNDNKTLLVFPLCASVAVLVLIAGYFGAAASSPLDLPGERTDDPVSILDYAAALVLYLAVFFVVIFFNTALVASAMQGLSGQPISVGSGLRAAYSRLGQIAGYAVIAATIGLVLRAIEERLPLAGRIVTRIIGLAWGAATFLVVPVLVHRGLGPMTAVKESALLLKKTWGENIIANAGLAIVFSLFYVPLMLVVFFAAYILITSTGEPQAGREDLVIAGTLFFGAVVLIFSLALIQSALQGIYGTVLYLYASNSGTAIADDFMAPDLLLSAFAPKRR